MVALNYSITGFICLFFAGMLAGGEFIVRYGLSGPLAAMDDRPHIQLRQLLIRKLRVIVPVIFFAALVPGVIGLFAIDPGFDFRCAGVLALLVWLSVTLAGTVPINKDVLTWQPDARPAGWLVQIDRWKRLDTCRAWLAVLAFACFLVAAAL